MTVSFQRAAFEERLRRLVGEGRRQAADGRPVLVSDTVAAPSLGLVALFERAQAQARVLWQQPSARLSMVAIGAAARLTGQGEGCFSQVAAAWRSLRARALIEVADSCPIPPPVCLGGFAFDPARQRDPVWREYPDALLMVPQFLFTSADGSSWLTVNSVVTPESDAGAVAGAMTAQLDELLQGGGAPCWGEQPAAALRLEEEMAAGPWQGVVGAVVGDIRRGVVEKLVLARRVPARAPVPLDPGPVLHRLRADYGNCTIFAFALGDDCFLGATPERLVRLDGRLVQADCLAGSIARGRTEEEDRSLGETLLADRKERHEHALVVRALRDALGPLCSRLRLKETPDLLRMPNVQHLHTPVVGVLRKEGHILDLVQRLHPTPAAAGLPRSAALSLIRSYEPFDRGWYAGPVGWVDGRGSGEFVVAIRSALLSGSQALLYAGCGIVADSDPEREYQESCLKLQPMLWALNGRGV